MVQRDIGKLSQPRLNELQRQKDIATVRPSGGNLASNVRSLPGNVISPGELPTCKQK